VALETLEYDYNIRGWLLGTNRGYLSGSGDHFFGFELSYDKRVSQSNGQVGNTYQSALYNGNIGGTVWRSKTDGERRKYDFSYDAANRLMKAEFTQWTAGSWNTSAGVNFSMQMGDGVTPGSAYDGNGNILAMKQYGLLLGGQSSLIDDLVYSYLPGSNKLKNVTDLVNNTDTKLGDFRSSQRYLSNGKSSSSQDYHYDVNGNLTRDLNKDIGTAAQDGITYNYLNLPQSIVVRNSSGGEKGTISYTYDAAGVKLRKTVSEVGQPEKVTLYVGGSVYEDGVIQFLGHEEGRIRYDATATEESNRFQYDYFVKDHLGNVRMVLAEERKVEVYPIASMEGDLSQGSSPVSVSKLFYDMEDSKVVLNPNTSLSYANNNGSIPTRQDASQTNQTSQKVYKLKATGGAGDIGVGMTLKVMGGDRVSLFGKAFYLGSTSGQTTSSVPVLALLNGLLSGAGGIGAQKGITGADLGGITAVSQAVNSHLGDPNRTVTARPKAALNWILFDEQFKVVSGSMGFRKLTVDAGVVQDLNELEIEMEKSGYLYVYCSNESSVDVFFDNIQVVHERSKVLEETHYYPFGLTMSGISSKAAGTLENKNEKFNGAELNTSFDLNTYEFFFRTYDPQIGRWHGLDTKPTDMVSLYAAMGNNPIRYADPLGDTLALFRPDGTFWKFQDDGKKEFSGMFYQKSTVTSTYEKDGVTYEVRTYSEGLAFQFNDPDVDVLAIKNGVASNGQVGITRVENMSDALVEKRIDASGVKSPEAQANPISFANQQGRQGNMDYGVRGIDAGDLKPNTFYIREKIAYNVADIGNYLFGRGVAELGINLGTASIGAHLNNMGSWIKGNGDYTPKYDFGPGTYGKPGLFDSQGDQRAISRGYSNSPKGAMLIKQYLQSWPKYNPK
jgi:RHS repeat-associated protein